MTKTTARILSVLLIACVFLAVRYLPWIEYFFTRGHVVLFFILVPIVGLAFGLLVPKAFTGYFFPPLKRGKNYRLWQIVFNRIFLLLNGM
jgi:hypothetical protein